MNHHNSCDNVNISSILHLEEFEKKATKTIDFPQLAAITGNEIALFTMLVLQEMIKQLAINPIANISNIIQLSNSIAMLNSSIKTIQ